MACGLAYANFCYATEPAGGPPGLKSNPPRTRSELEAEARFEESMRAGNYVEAVEAAKFIVLYTMESTASDDLIAAALEQLARAQKFSGELDAAIQNFEASIEYIELGSDRLDRKLVAPLHGLAQILAEKGDFGAAVDRYARALHITHVNEGPLNLDQAEILGELVDLYTELGEFDQARPYQELELSIYRREYSETDPRVVQAWQRKGRLLTASGEHHQAQQTFEFAMDTMRMSDGNDSLAQIPLLYDLSDSFLRYAVADKFTRIEMARSQLDRAASIVERNPDTTAEQRAAAHLRLGDFMQRYGDWNSALSSYRRAWDCLESELSPENMRNQVFGEPVLLSQEPDGDTDPVIASMPGARRAILVAHDVNKRGRVENARASQEGEENTESLRRTLSHVRAGVYRPRFVDGDPVDTIGIVRRVELTQ